MKTSYVDITSRIKAPPLWWDEAGVPRYCEFHPSEIADISAQEAALVFITCQRCGNPWRTAISYDATKSKKPPLAVRISDRALDYGDPPNTGCCAAGATMNSVTHEVLQFWQRNASFQWRRAPRLEGACLSRHVNEAGDVG